MNDEQSRLFSEPVRTPPDVEKFRKNVYGWYEQFGRHDLPWRETVDPWHILISEIMLQQTQVDRVREKYLIFTDTFPTPAALAGASQADVLRLWKGLGYNRRALFLKKAAEAIAAEHGAVVPNDNDALVALPGIGPNTAAAIRAYAFNQPAVYVETNIRAVYIHHFFPGEEKVLDADILPIVERTLDRSNPRRWYSALMDYGAELKRRTKNPARRSAHHTVQSRFEGSDRQIRGRILEMLLNHSYAEEDLITALGDESDRYRRIIAGLEKEGFIVREEKSRYRLSD